jgi:heme/copper-type cytochrome/quinol oxidase subunit 4
MKMLETIIDIFSQVFLVLAFVSPFITIPFFLKNKNLSKGQSIFLGLIAAILISIACIILSMYILFRNGVGPG